MATVDLTFPASTGRPMRAALALPAGPGPRPAVIVIHEIFGAVRAPLRAAGIFYGDVPTAAESLKGVYPDAGHSYMSRHEGLFATIAAYAPLAAGFDAGAEADSWARIEGFFRAQLG